MKQILKLNAYTEKLNDKSLQVTLKSLLLHHHHYDVRFLQLSKFLLIQTELYYRFSRVEKCVRGIEFDLVMIF